MQDYLIEPNDDLSTVLDKTKRLGDRILDGRSIAVALGDIKIQRNEEHEQKAFNLREKHIWQVWKSGRGDLPTMQWQADLVEEEEEEEEKKHGKDDAQIQNQSDERQVQNLGKRKSNSLPQQRNTKRRHEKEVTELDMAALGEIYQLSPESRERVTEADVRHFRQSFPTLRPLLSAMTKALYARLYQTSSNENKKKEKEQRAIESHSTHKAIYLAEKHINWILEDASTYIEAIREQISLMRGRLSAVNEENQDEDDDDDEFMSEASSSARDALTPIEDAEPPTPFINGNNEQERRADDDHERIDKDMSLNVHRQDQDQASVQAGEERLEAEEERQEQVVDHEHFVRPELLTKDTSTLQEPIVSPNETVGDYNQASEDQAHHQSDETVVHDAAAAILVPNEDAAVERYIGLSEQQRLALQEGLLALQSTMHQVSPEKESAKHAEQRDLHKEQVDHNEAIDRGSHKDHSIENVEADVVQKYNSLPSAIESSRQIRDFQSPVPPSSYSEIDRQEQLLQQIEAPSRTMFSRFSGPLPGTTCERRQLSASLSQAIGLPGMRAKAPLPRSWQNDVPEIPQQTKEAVEDLHNFAPSASAPHLQDSPFPSSNPRSFYDF